MRKTTTYVTCLVLLIQFVLSAQNYQQDSLKVEELVEGLETYYHDVGRYKKNFPLALEIIDKIILTDRKSRYFEVKRAAIIDRQSSLLKIDEKYDEALRLLLDNVSYKEKIGDFKTLAYTYRLIASIFVWEENYEKAKQYYSIGLEYAQKFDNREEEIEALLSQSRLLVITEEFPAAEARIDSALFHLESLDYPIGLSRAYSSYVAIMRKQEKYKEAIYYSERHIEALRQANDSLGLGFAYFNLGITYHDFQKFHLAIDPLIKSIEVEKESISPGRIKSRYQLLSENYAEVGDFKNAYYYAAKYTDANEQEGRIEAYKNSLDQEAKFQYERQRVVDSLQFLRKKRDIEFEIRRKSNNRFWIVVGSLLMLVVAMWGLYFKRKQKVLTTELKNKLLHAEIASKKKDLSEFALSLNQDKEWTKTLFKQFQRYKDSREEDKEKEIQLLELEITNKLNYDEIDKEFNKRLDTLSNTFYDSLKKRFPTLTKNDIRLCTFIKLKIETPEIANLQNISVASVNSSRYRLRKKLKLSSSDSLDEYLDSFI